MKNRTTLGKAEDDCLLMTKEAARYLKVSHRTMEDWRLRGDGPDFSYAGRRVLYWRSVLDAFLEARTFRNTAEAKLAMRQIQPLGPKRPPEEFADEIPF